MNFKVVVQALRLLLGITEQVVDLVTETKIPKANQPDLHEELNIALERLVRAKSKIAIDPDEITK